MKKFALLFMVAAFCAAGFAQNGYSSYDLDELDDGADASAMENRALLDVGASFFYAKRHSHRQDIPNFVVRGFGPSVAAFIPFSAEGKWGIDLGLSAFINKEGNFVYSRIDGTDKTPVNVYFPNFGFRFAPAVKYQFLNKTDQKFSGGFSLNAVYYSRKNFTEEDGDSKALFAGVGVSFDYKQFVSKICYIKFAASADLDVISFILKGKTEADGEKLTIGDTFAIMPEFAIGFRF